MKSGISGFSVREIAHRTHVPKSTIYRRWRSRSDLLRTVLEQLASEEEPVPNLGSLRADLVEVARRRVESFMSEGHTLEQLGMEARDDPELAEVVREWLNRRLRAHAPIFDRAIARQELRPSVDFDAALDLIFGVIWARALTLDLSPGFAERVVDSVLAGLLPRQET